MTNTALQRRPELRALSRAALAYEKQADVARLIAYPRLDASAQDTYANPNQRYFPQTDEFNNSWQVGVQLTRCASTSTTSSRSAPIASPVSNAELRAAPRRRM